jgi:hypothetical protein
MIFSHVGLGVLALALARAGHRLAVAPGEERLAVLVHLEVRDDAVARVDADGDLHLVGLGGGDALNVDNELAPVHGGDLADLLLELAADNGDLGGREKKKTKNKKNEKKNAKEQQKRQCKSIGPENIKKMLTKAPTSSSLTSGTERTCGLSDHHQKFRLFT